MYLWASKMAQVKILVVMPDALGLITKIQMVEGEKQLSKASTDFYIHTTVCTQHTHLYTHVHTHINTHKHAHTYIDTSYLTDHCCVTYMNLHVCSLCGCWQSRKRPCPYVLHTTPIPLFTYICPSPAHLCILSAFIFPSSSFPATKCLAAWHCFIFFLSSIVSPQLQSGTELIVSVLEVSKQSACD